MVPAGARPWIERLARAGYTAKGVVYLMIGLLAFQAAIGSGGRATDTRGVLHVLLRQPLGRVLLAAAGLLGYALRRAVSALNDPEAQSGDWKRLVSRWATAPAADTRRTAGPPG